MTGPLKKMYFLRLPFMVTTFDFEGRDTDILIVKEMVKKRERKDMNRKGER